MTASRRLRVHVEPGQKYGNFELVAFVDVGKHGQRWLVRCACGREAVRVLAVLRSLSRDTSRVLQCAPCTRRDSQRYRATRRPAAGAALASRLGDRRAFELLDRSESNADEWLSECDLSFPLFARRDRSP